LNIINIWELAWPNCCRSCLCCIYVSDICVLRYSMDCYFPYQETGGREIRGLQQLQLFLVDHSLYSLN